MLTPRIVKITGERIDHDFIHLELYRFSTALERLGRLSPRIR